MKEFEKWMKGLPEQSNNLDLFVLEEALEDWKEERTILKTLLQKCYDCFNSCEQDGFNNGVFTSEIMAEIKDKIKS